MDTLCSRHEFRLGCDMHFIELFVVIQIHRLKVKNHFLMVARCTKLAFKGYVSFSKRAYRMSLSMVCNVYREIV